MIKYKILYVEDDETLAFLTQDNLEQNNYEVTHCVDGLSALEQFKTSHFDICVLDIMMPKLDGFELTEAIRSLNSNIPIIFLSAKTLKEDRIKGLKLGADDYLVKPFSIEELLLKIEIFLKRAQKSIPIQENKVSMVGNFCFTFQDFSLENQDKKITLTQREAELLDFFIANKNKVLKREEILKAIWGSDDYFLGRSLDVFISRLRKIFSEEPNVKIENLHGIGFKFHLK